MRHEPNREPQFYVTAPQKCPYIKGKIERKLFTALYGRNTISLNDDLSLQGFRRSQKVLYRPLCSNCSACLSIRVKVNEFYYSKSQKRVINKNKKLIRVKKKPEATDEQFEIFKKYLNCRHLNGGMSDMDAHEFSSMIEETNVDSQIFEYWEFKKEEKKQLAAVCLTDTNRDGLSMVYSFYDPKCNSQSLGKFMILDHINLTKKRDLDYLYLGYWIRGNPKMGYKSNYFPAEVFYKNQWKEVNKTNINKFDLNSGQKIPNKQKSSNLEGIIQLPRFSKDPD